MCLLPAPSWAGTKLPGRVASPMGPRAMGLGGRHTADAVKGKCMARGRSGCRGHRCLSRVDARTKSQCPQEPDRSRASPPHPLTSGFSDRAGLGWPLSAPGVGEHSPLPPNLQRPQASGWGGAGAPLGPQTLYTTPMPPSTPTESEGPSLSRDQNLGWGCG